MNNKTQKSDVLHGRAADSARGSGSRLAAAHTLPLLFAPAAWYALLALILPAPFRAHAQTFTTRWEQLECAAELRWRTASNDAPAPCSLAAALSAAALYDDLRARLDDPADSLDDLDRYQPVLALDGVPRTLYDRAQELFWQRDYPRAQHLFAFLLLPGNPDGFTIGNSHFWLGYLLDAYHGKPAAALPHYLLVHSYPACLVYTACAYHYAARIYHRNGLRDIALALYATQIPSIDYWRNELANARAALAVSFDQASPTNVVLQLLRIQRAAAALGLDDSTTIMAAHRRLSRVMPVTHIDTLAHQLAHTYSPMQHEAESIQRALLGPDAATNNPALVDMLLHAWPTLETVAELHPEILTNRPASNNIFPHLRRALP